MRHAAFSADGSRVVSVNEWGARVWDTATGEALTERLAHAGSSLRTAAFSPGGELLVTGGADRAARVWRIATGEQALPALRHEGSLVYVEFSPDGRRVATASRDGSARLWDAATGQPLTPPLRHRGAVLQARFHPGVGRRLLTASADGTARVWEFEPFPGSLEELRGLSRLLSGRKIRPGGLLPLEKAELERVFEASRGGDAN